VIVNLCGAAQAGRIHWDDLQLKGRYRALTATMQGARANELLATAYTSERTKYVLYNPVFVATGLHEPFRPPLRGIVRLASRLFAQPVTKAVPPIVELIDKPPAEPVTAWKKGKAIELGVDPVEAQRLEEAVRVLGG
jgi:hypothetical protein